MYSPFKPFIFMGNNIIPNNNNSPSSSTIFLSEKDLAPLNSMDCNFLSRPSLDFPETCQMVTSSSSTKESNDDEKHKQERYEVLLSSLKVKLPNIVNKEKEEEEEGCKTPTSPEYRIPVDCPPAPRKPKAMPLAAKRKGCHKRVFLDLSVEVESLFPPNLGNKKLKKIRSS